MAPKVALMVMLACVLLATPYTEALIPGGAVPPPGGTLPSKCGVNMGYPVSLPVDCSNNSNSSSSTTSTSISNSISTSTGNNDQLPAPNATLN